MAPWLTELSRDHSYIRYDQRGCGLSDREVTDLSLDAWVSDLEAVVDALGLKRFPLFGMSQGGCDRDRLCGTPSGTSVAVGFCGRLCARCDFAEEAMRSSGSRRKRLVNLIRVGWGGNHPGSGKYFRYRFIPRGTPEQLQWWGDLEQVTASADVAARTLEAFQQIDVSELARQLSVPTLILHSRRDAAVPFDEGRLLAALIPGARFVPLESDNHVLLDTEAAWPLFLSEVRAFLELSPQQNVADIAEQGSLTTAEREVLQLVAEGLDNRAIAERLLKSEKTVRNQVSIIFDKLGVRTRAEAIVKARNPQVHL